MLLYLDHEVVVIDNNLVYAARGVNEAGKASGPSPWGEIAGCSSEPPAVASITSVVESRKGMGINVRSYLSDVLPRPAAAQPDQVAALAATLTPVRWFAARTPAAAQVPTEAAGNPA